MNVTVSCMSTLKRYFVNIPVVATVMCVWLGVVISIMCELGIFSNSNFVAFGPRPELRFMHVPIDTYYKYNELITLIVLHTIITDVIADSLGPHVLNVVQDPKNLFLPYRAYTYISITSVWSLYCAITQLFSIFIAFAQLDLLVVRLLSDIFANFLTMNMYLHGKSYDPQRYYDLHGVHLPSAASVAAADAAADAEGGDSEMLLSVRQANKI